MLLPVLFALFALSSCTEDEQLCPKQCRVRCSNPNPKNCDTQIANLPTCKCLPDDIYESTTGKCIAISDCPTYLGCNGDPNAVIKEYPPACPLSCQQPTPYPCKRPVFRFGCVCKHGFILNTDTGKCVRKDQCPVDKKLCPKRCRVTCANPNPKNCDSQIANLPTCTCSLPGYIYASTTGKCIKICECPTNLGCNGDPNAVIQEYPPACPLTCNQPTPYPCKRPIPRFGCVCKHGFILNSDTGKCVRKEQCPNYCPGDDHSSSSEESCEDDNPCTGVNEEVDPCPSPCYSDSCADVPFRTAPCNTLLPIECVPACRCKSAFARSNGVCIPVNQCP